MTRKRKWLIGTGAAVGGLIIALVIVFAWLLYTPSGLRFVLDRGVAMMHGQFTYQSASGTLAGETTINGLTYRTDSGDTLHVRKTTLDLRLAALIGHKLHIARARIDGVTLDMVPSNQPSQFSLKPPMTVVLDDTLLTDIRVNNDGKPFFAANSLAVAGMWSARQLVVRQLALKAPAGSAELNGTVALAPSHRGHGTAKFDWTRDGTHYAGSLTSKSDGKTARLEASITAPTAITLDASLGLGKTRPWTLTLRAPKFDTDKLAVLPSSLKTLALDIKGHGEAATGTLTGDLVANGHTLRIAPAKFAWHDKTLSLEPLRLQSPEIAGTASVTGVVHLEAKPTTFALAAKWSDVRLPADLVKQPLATHGDVKLKGSIEHYALTGALALGPPGHLSNLTVDLAGTPKQIELHALKLVQPQGSLDMQGSVALQPERTWKLDAVAQHFDPGAILAGWNGALDFKLATQGTLTPQGPRGTLKLSNARGSLRGHDIAGSKADLKIAPGNLLDGSMLLVAGASRVHAVGKAGPQTNATVTLDIASLGDWMPNASGKLGGQFTIKGKWPKLAVAGHLDGHGLTLGTRSIDALHLTASVPDLSRPGGTLDLALTGVHASGLDFASVTLRGNGTAASHHLTLRARGRQLSASAALAGTWQARTKRWTGTLSQVELTPQGIPAWHQQQASTIVWQKGAITLSQFCLASGAPRICFSGGRNRKGTMTAKYAITRLPLQLLATLAPSLKQVEASGDLSGSGQFTIAKTGTMQGNGSLAASAGHILYTANPGQPLLAWSSIKVDVTAAGTNQHVRVRGALSDGGHLNGDVSVRGTGHALAGTLDVNLRSLAALEALSTEIDDVKGSLAGRLTLGGTLAAPRFQGRIQASNFSAEVPRAGIKLSDGTFAVVGSPAGRLELQGQVTSGKGVLHLGGNMGLASGAPLKLNIKGDNVLVADIPAAHVDASPDLHIQRANGKFAVTGAVAIPSATVKIEKLPGEGPTKASPDIVIVDEPKKQQVAPLAMTADIHVRLGNEVKVEGFGFKGKVHGQLAVHVQPNRNATGTGEIIVDGKYQAYGQDLTIENGRVLYADARLDNPGLNIRAIRRIRADDVTVGLSIQGTAEHPDVTIFSDPSMQQTEALSYLVTGRSLSGLKSGQGHALNSAAQALGGLAGNKLGKLIGSRLGIQAGVSNSQALGTSTFTAGKYLSPRLFLSYGVGLFTPGQVITLRYTLNRFLQFEAENASTGNRASLNYRISK